MAKLIKTDTIFPYKKATLRDYSGDISKVWHIEFYVFDDKEKKLKRCRKNLAEPTAKHRLTKARYIIKEINKTLESGACINLVNKNTAKLETRSTLKTTITFYLEYKKQILRPNSYRSLSADFNRFIEFLDQKNKYTFITQFAEEDAQAFADYLTLKKKIGNRSRNNTISTMITFFNFLKNRKLTPINPFQHITKLPTEARKHTAFSKIQADAMKAEIIKAEDHQLLLFISFIYYCALRPRTELLTLKVGDIQNGTLKINAQHAKNRQTQYVKIPEPLIRLLETQKILTYPENYFIFGRKETPGPLPREENTLYFRHKAILKKLKLENKNLDTYSWKHTGVIAFYRAIKEIELIRLHCRHSDLGTTIKYLRDLGQFVDHQQFEQFPEM
jgi:integrase